MKDSMITTYRKHLGCGCTIERVRNGVTVRTLCESHAYSAEYPDARADAHLIADRLRRIGDSLDALRELVGQLDKEWAERANCVESTIATWGSVAEHAIIGLRRAVEESSPLQPEPCDNCDKPTRQRASVAGELRPLCAGCRLGWQPGAWDGEERPEDDTIGGLLDDLEAANRRVRRRVDQRIAALTERERAVLRSRLQRDDRASASDSNVIKVACGDCSNVLRVAAEQYYRGDVPTCPVCFPMPADGGEPDDDLGRDPLSEEERARFEAESHGRPHPPPEAVERALEALDREDDASMMGGPDARPAAAAESAGVRPSCESQGPEGRQGGGSNTPPCNPAAAGGTLTRPPGSGPKRPAPPSVPRRSRPEV